MKIVYEKPRAPSLAPWIRRIFTGWLLAAALEYILLEPEWRDLSVLAGIGMMSAGRMVLTVAAVTALLFVLERFVPEVCSRWIPAVAAAGLSVLALQVSFAWPLFFACLLVEIVLMVYALWGWNGEARGIPVRCREDRRFLWATAAVAVAFFAFVSVWTVSRIYCFMAPTFDFGIFSQMFHSMKTTGLPITTVERDGALSHFAVHVSPIYYLMLPFYMIVPKPATLQVLQAAVLASAVIPMWKLGKHHNLTPAVRFGLCLLLLVYPAYSGGTSYDLHENAFLTPLLLWLFYGIDRRNGILTAVAAVLTLMVKEDAAVYVAIVALYLLLRSGLSQDRKWGLLAGGGMLVGALIWFVAVTGYLSGSGDGVMTYRYDNFMYDGSDSLITVVKAVLLCPLKAVFECVDSQKLKFIGLTMGTLAFLPLMTRRYERLVLLIPYLLVNLMSDYQYQFDVFFQYTYGSTACLLYLVLVNLADWKDAGIRLAALGLAVGLSISGFGAQIVPKAVSYPEYCITYGDYYDGIRAVLDKIPEDASVAATTYYTVHLSKRDVLYDVRYASTEHILSCEYVVLNITEDSSYKKFAVDGKNGFENLVELLKSQGYAKFAEYPGKVEIYRKG